MGRADEAGHRDLRDGDRAARQEGAREQCGDSAHAPERGAGGGQQRAHDEHRLDRPPAGERRSERRQRAEAQHRQRRHQARGSGGQLEVAPDVGQQRRKAGDDGAEVDREQDDREESEAGRYVAAGVP